MKASWGLLALNFAIILTVMLRIMGGSWRVLRSPRIAGMLVALYAGGILMLKFGISPIRAREGVVLAGTDFALYLVGGVLAFGGLILGMGSYMLRGRTLMTSMDRLDGYLQGSAPLAFPMADDAARRDLAVVAVLLRDPALAKRYPAEVHERVAALDARSLPAPRG